MNLACAFTYVFIDLCLSRELHALRESMGALIRLRSFLIPSTDERQVYDYLLTLDEEVFLVWPSRFGAPKALFFLNRYFPFADLSLLVYGTQL